MEIQLHLQVVEKKIKSSMILFKAPRFTNLIIRKVGPLQFYYNIKRFLVLEFANG